MDAFEPSLCLTVTLGRRTTRLAGDAVLAVFNPSGISRCRSGVMRRFLDHSGLSGVIDFECNHDQVAVRRRSRRRRQDLPDRQPGGAGPARRLAGRAAAATWSRSWGRPAAARRRCSTASAASTRSTAASSGSTASTSASSRTTSKSGYRARSMGFVFQFYNLLPVLSAVENVELPLLVSGVPAKEARERAMHALELVHLRRLGDAPAGAALRRSAPARDHRPRPGQQAGHRLGRRADRRPRLEERGRDHGPDRRPQRDATVRPSSSSRTTSASRSAPSASSTCSTARSSTRRMTDRGRARAGAAGVALRRLP